MQTPNDTGLRTTVMVACLLVLALAMIAMAVSGTTQTDFSKFSHVVYDTIRAMAENI